MPDYSSTPLIRKLGIREGMRATFVNAPDDFSGTLGELPADLTIVKTPRAPMDFLLFFTPRAGELAARFPKLAATLAPAGMLWIAWPKKSSGVETDITFDVVQRIGLDAGLVDVKICAIDARWTGLKFVIRLRDRKER
ncbi:MAG TPA: DUF3052 domain-containing protein [Candidatus Kapabacteria bacterium]|nr:DUF3052 domain-containing protein [Candidatus Kapabacteria bacterium]